MRSVVLGIASLWPGAVQAWLLASGRGLLLAIGFAAALNLALVGTFAWPSWPAWLPAGSAAAMAWLLVLGLWGAGLAWVRRDWSKLAAKRGGNAPELDTWFVEAQHEYLKGHWVEAETAIRRLLERQPNDSEAMLLLASIQRRTGRVAEARNTLIELEQRGLVGKWPLEISRELSQLEQKRQANEQVETETGAVTDESSAAADGQRRAA